MPDDLILVMDSDDDLVLVDDIPYGEHYDDYTGPYTVTPILNDDQQLRTINKHMTDNVTVKAIPVTETTNPYGGRTIVIG